MHFSTASFAPAPAHSLSTVVLCAAAVEKAAAEVASAAVARTSSDRRAGRRACTA